MTSCRFTFDLSFIKSKAMHPKFHYQLTGELIRSADNSLNPVVINREISNQEPVLARQKALAEFMSFVEVLLEFHGFEYSTYEEALWRLEQHISRGRTVHIRMADLLIDRLDNDFDLGLNLYLVKDNTKFVKSLEGDILYSEIVLIHSFSADFKSLSKLIFANLELEYLWYRKNGYNCNNAIVRYDFSEFPVLQTPVDYNKYSLDWAI